MCTPITRFARDELSFNLYPRQAAILDEVYSDGIRTAIWRLGRRSGKGRLASLVCVFEGVVNHGAHLAAVPPGERPVIVLIAGSREQARVNMGFVKSYLSTPILRPLVENTTADRVDLTTGMSIMVVPCHAGLVRGLSVPVVVADEIAWWVGRESSPIDPKEVMDAVIPATALFPERRVILTSTPRLAGGYFYDMSKRAQAGLDPTMREWHYSTAEVNPKVPRSFLEAEEAADPANYRREYLALFESAISAALDPDAVQAAVEARGDQPPVPGQQYLISTDPAASHDAWAVTVGHREPDGRVVVDLSKAWQGRPGAPVQVDAVLDELAALATVYNGAEVISDQWAGVVLQQQLTKRGVRVRLEPWTNESRYAATQTLRRLLYAGQLSLPDDRVLVGELLALEQRPTAGGRPRIAAGHGHDDRASALMGLCAELGAGHVGYASASIEPKPGHFAAPRRFPGRRLRDGVPGASRLH